LTREFVFLPVTNPISEGAWIYFQRVAHTLERERSVSVVVENPELSFPEFLPSGRLKRSVIALKTSHRIDQQARHQAHDRLDLRRTAARRVKLCGHDGIAAKFIACRAPRIDSRSWIVHDSPYLHGLPAKEKEAHTAEEFLRGRGTETALRPCGQVQVLYLNASTFTGVKNDCTTW
jgi:hypothetical protein